MLCIREQQTDMLSSLPTKGKHQALYLSIDLYLPFTGFSEGAPGANPEG